MIPYFFIVSMVWFLLKIINEDITLKYLNFLSASVRPLRKSMKWTTKKFIDHAACSVSSLFSKYYCKLYINVNQILADSIFYISTVGDRHVLTKIFKKFPKFLSRQKFLGSVGQRSANNYLRMLLIKPANTFGYSMHTLFLTNWLKYQRYRRFT